MGSGVLPLAMATRPAKAPLCCAPAEIVGSELCVVCLLERSGLPLALMVLAAGRGAKADRAISTGQLRGLPRFHLRPINVMVSHGSQRDLVLRGVSRLDAFSGYPVRT
jgi:hypothetical protein